MSEFLAFCFGVGLTVYVSLLAHPERNHIKSCKDGTCSYLATVNGTEEDCKRVMGLIKSEEFFFVCE